MAAVALLVLAGCGSTGYPSGSNYPNGSYNNEIQGTVSYVDRNNGYIELTKASGYAPMLSSSGSGNTVRIYYDRNTTVQYNGRTYRAADLERGDQVSINVYNNTAQSISVNRSISDNGTYGNNSSNYATVRGTVRYVDTSAHTIQLDQTNWVSGFNTNTNGTTMTVQYDPNNTNVDVSGRLNPVSGLERGDVIDVQVSNAGSSL